MIGTGLLNSMFLLGCSSLLLFSCSSSKTEEGKRIVRMAEEYIPLAVGNQWIYTYGLDANPTRQEVTVVGKKVIDGITWYQIEYSFPVDGDADTILLRNDRERHIAYLVSMNQETILIDFGRSSLDSTSLETAVVKETGKTVEAGGNTYSDCIVISSGFIDAGVDTYAPGVGLVESWWFRGRKRLVGGRIAGKDIMQQK